MCFDRGQFQGREQFTSLGYTFLVEMLIRFSLTIGLAFLLPLAFSSYAFAIGFLGSFLVTHHLFKQGISKSKGNEENLKPIYLFLKVVTLYEFGQILINNADVILVNHLFSDVEAGLYASLAILGKTVFFATGIVVTILFPKVVNRQRQGLNHSGLFWKSFSIVFFIGFSMVLGSAVLGEQVILMAFGEAYVSMADYLWLYALLTCLFSCSNVFVYYYMTLDSYLPVIISILAGLLQVGLFLVFGSSIANVLAIQVYVMTALLLVLFSYYYLNKHSLSRLRVACATIKSL